MTNYCEWCHRADDFIPPQYKPKTNSLICCSKCGREVVMITITQASIVSDVSRETIYRWIREGRVSSIENPGGHRRVCYSSLFNPPREAIEDPQTEELKMKPVTIPKTK